MSEQTNSEIHHRLQLSRRTGAMKNRAPVPTKPLETQGGRMRIAKQASTGQWPPRARGGRKATEAFSCTALSRSEPIQSVHASPKFFVIVLPLLDTFYLFFTTLAFHFYRCRCSRYTNCGRYGHRSPRILVTSGGGVDLLARRSSYGAHHLRGIQGKET